MFPHLSVAEYRDLSKSCRPYHPNPFMPHVDGPWHERVFAAVVDGVTNLLGRYDSGLVTERQLLRGKDNDKRPGLNGHASCYDTLSYWLYFQHHKGNERDKVLGQRYWSVEAILSWRVKFNSLPTDQRASRKDGRYSTRTFPKGGLNGLVSEHVVPKKEMKKLLLATRDREMIASLLRLNLCCVVTGAEDGRLERSQHPNPHEPWERYRGLDIIIAHNPAWTDDEIASLLNCRLLSERSLWISEA